MINIVIPIAGRAQRFIDRGYTAPKPLIMVKDQHMIDLAMGSIKHEGCRLIFCVRKDHVTSHNIDQILREKYGEHVEIVVVEEITRGTLCTCLLAKWVIDKSEPLIIYTPDVVFEPQFDPTSLEDFDGFLMTFKANNPAHSYARLGESGLVEETAEKSVISDQAAVGVYYFKSGQMFINHAEEMVEDEITTNGEFYVCPIYNSIIREGGAVGTRLVEKMHVLGTPEELAFYTGRTLKRFGDKPVVLCSDHSGFNAKEMMKTQLDEADIPYVDFGTYSKQDCDHHDFLFPAIQHIRQGEADFGMAFCRTGQGFNIAANKADPNIRSALIYNEYAAEMAIRHNCANFFCVPSHGTTPSDLHAMIEKWRTATFDGGRHMTRITRSEAGYDG